MSKSFRIAALAVLLAPAGLVAQGRSTVSSAQLQTATRTAAPALSRQALERLLATSDARQQATRLGTSTEALTAQVARMDQAAIDRFAREHGLSDQALAGGRDTIIISTTAVIIGLLILILLTD